MNQTEALQLLFRFEGFDVTLAEARKIVTYTLRANTLALWEVSYPENKWEQDIKTLLAQSEKQIQILCKAGKCPPIVYDDGLYPISFLFPSGRSNGPDKLDKCWHYHPGEKINFLHYANDYGKKGSES